VVPVELEAGFSGVYIGFEKQRSKTMAAARIAGEPRVSPPIDFANGDYGVVIFSPIVEAGRFTGFMSGGISSARLLHKIETDRVGEDFSYDIHDGDRQILRHDADSTDPSAEWTKEIALDASGASWQIRVWPSTQYLRVSRSGVPTQIVVVATAFGLLTSLVVSLAQEAVRRRQTAEATAAALSRSNDELSDARRTADNANAAKTQFLANVSHEIRTPLGVMIGYSEMLADPKMDPAQVTRIGETIRRNGESLLSLVNDLLDLSKVESGNLPIERRHVPLGQVVADAIALIMPQARSKGLRVTTTYEGQVPVIVETDPLRLGQILVNLLANAVKFTDAGAIDVIVRLEACVDGAHLEVKVRDTGIGIDTSQQAGLFAPFFQAKRLATQRFGGTGLGLSVSRHLARALGGNLWLQRSESGQGSTFVVTIDAGRFEGLRTVPQGEALAPVATPSTPPENTPQCSLVGLAVLLVDDFADNRNLMTCLVQAEGAVVVTATDGRDGVRKALERSFDAILMDLQMPVMDGYEAVAKLRDAGCATPIVALTAHGMRGERERCLASGFTDYLCKPVKRAALVTTVARHACHSAGG
jgi:signal transduction histidine kinase